MKRALALALCAAILCCGLPALAHDSQDDHDSDLKLVLFGNADYLPQGEQREIFQAIADAAALCIDQFSANKSAQSKRQEFEELSRQVDLSMSFDDIDLNQSIGGGNITPNTHRLYTHLGWDFSEYPDDAFWEARKEILLQTVRQELFGDSIPDIPLISGIVSRLTEPSEQCIAFCELVYGIHILGDHLVGNAPGKLAALEPLARSNDLSNPGVIPELQQSLQTLFADQQDTRTFLSLMQELDVLRRDAEEVYSSWGGINTEEKCAINMENARSLLTLLGDKVPILLRNEDFFIQAFYSS